MPSIIGSGIVKSLNGAFQPSASTIVNDDISPLAGIAQSKIQNLADDLSEKAKTANIQTFTSSSTWIKPIGAKVINIQLFAAGMGGSSGTRGAAGTNRISGGGGGGGGYYSVTVDASLLASSEIVTIGAGGIGGRPRTINEIGETGVAGGNTSFGSFLVTGGSSNLYSDAGTGGSIFGGNGAPGTNAAGISSAPSTQSTTTTAMTRGGGSGGGLNTTNVAFNGGTGALSIIAGSTIPTPGGSATGVKNGSDGLSVTAGIPICGAGGGGGASSISGNAGNGGAGGFPSGGGGGGGASQEFDSGGGGVGADGMAVITTYF
jgi:hypothetical protein